jgi:hypothetical protein
MLCSLGITTYHRAYIDMQKTDELGAYSFPHKLNMTEETYASVVERTGI